MLCFYLGNTAYKQMNKITEFVFLNANIDHVNMFSFNQYFKEIEAGDLLYNG